MKRKPRTAAQLRCYDNGGKTADRYTILPARHWREMRNALHGGCWYAIGASAEPFAPHGIGQSTEAAPGRHLGKRVRFDTLPRDVQTFARQAFRLLSPTQEYLRGLLAWLDRVEARGDAGSDFICAVIAERDNMREALTRDGVTL